MCYKIQKLQGGNTEPPALVRHAQNNGEEIVQSHEDCEIVNKDSQIHRSYRGNTKYIIPDRRKSVNRNFLKVHLQKPQSAGTTAGSASETSAASGEA